jgi:hypothetical protein
VRVQGFAGADQCLCREFGRGAVYGHAALPDRIQRLRCDIDIDEFCETR